MIREKNFIIYNFVDSVNATATDLMNIKKKFVDSQSNMPFKFDDLKVLK